MLSFLNPLISLCSILSLPPIVMGTKTHKVYATAIEMPIGYRFLPTDLELVTFYLINKIHSSPIPVEFIQSIDAAQFYTKSPETLLEESFLHDDVKDESYFFVNRQSQQNVRVIKQHGIEIRVVGNEIGFWRAVDDRIPIYDSDGKKLAFKLGFLYFVGAPQNPLKKTNWIMEEYYLPIGCRKDVEEVHEWVLVRLHNEKSGYDSS